MRTLSVVVCVYLIYASSLVNIIGSVGPDSPNPRAARDRNINYKEKNGWVEHESNLRSNAEHNKPREYLERRQIRHSHLHKDEHSLRSWRQDDKFIRASELFDLNSHKTNYQYKFPETEYRNSERHTTQKPLINWNDYTERSVRKVSKTNSEDHLFTDDLSDYEDDDFYDEYDESDDSFSDEDEDDEEIDRSVHLDHEIMQPTDTHQSLHYKPPQTDTEPDIFHDTPSQDDYDELEDSPQSDASDDSSHTESSTKTLKWEIASVGHNRGNRKVKKVDTRAAVQHATMMATAASCKHPQPRVISIQTVHPNHSKQYTPQCTILYRCGEDTGCCSSDVATCSPKSIETIHLYFFTKTVGRLNSDVERLAFENHTECECVDRRNEMMVKDEIAFLSIKPTISWKENAEYNFATETEAPIIKRCHCPTEYSVQILDNGDCECDCQSKQKDCMRIKRGKEYFGLKDRLCIQRGHCKTPNCEFGIYNSKTGRCPKRQEKIDETHKTKLFGK